MLLRSIANQICKTVKMAVQRKEPAERDRTAELSNMNLSHGKLSCCVNQCEWPSWKIALGTTLAMGMYRQFVLGLPRNKDASDNKFFIKKDDR